jgi:DEAD/DEAH box helicase domain-containing protein
MYSFWEKELSKMWEYFQGAQRIIGFNSLGFDVPVLKPYAPNYFSKLPHFDIMQKFKEIANHRISLNSLAKTTLGKSKIDSGLNAVTYWQKGDPKSLAKLKKYCEADVLLTKDLYHHALINQELSYLDKWNTVRKITVDFSYPKPKDEINQGSLF